MGLGGKGGSLSVRGGKRRWRWRGAARLSDDGNGAQGLQLSGKPLSRRLFHPLPGAQTLVRECAGDGVERQPQPARNRRGRPPLALGAGLGRAHHVDVKGSTRHG